MLPAHAPGLQSTADASVDAAMRSKAERRADFGKGSEGDVAYWIAEIQASDKETMQWRQVAARVVKRYRDERQTSALTGNEKKYNILWSNINTTMPAVYGKAPEPVVMRRFTDPDNVARVASIILERCLEFQICQQHDFNAAIKNALQDRLLPGMGSIWVRYQDGQKSPTKTLDNDYYARLSGKVAAVDFVYWEDFGFIPSRTWEEVPAVWRIVYMNRDQLVARFGEEVGGDVPLDYVPARHPTTNDSTTETDEPKNKVFRQAKVYEIWDKRTSRVYWVNRHYPKLLDSADDPVGFPGFFPCPKPMFATNTTGNLVPVPDYYMYQDQAYEIDNLTQRLYMLTKALKVVGVYDAEQLPIQRMLTEGVDNQLIPVDTWAAFAEKGGIKGVVDFLPLEEIIVVVEKLFDIRQQLIQDIYQITGLSDIIRGASNPRETLGAQKIKAQFASTRLDAMKDEMARFVTDALRLMAHIMVEFFDDQTLIDQSAILQSPDGQKAIKDAQAAMAARVSPAPGAMGAPPPGGMGMGGVQPGLPPAPGGPPPMVPAAPALGAGGGAPALGPVAQPPPGPAPQENVIAGALGLLRKGKLADFRIMVAADTLVEADLESERTAANAFLTGVTQFLQQAIPAAESNPALGPLLNTLLMFGIRNFRMGRDIEGQIESAMQELASAPPKEEPPDPKLAAVEAKAKADQAAQQADTQAQMAKISAEAQAAQEESQRKMLELSAELQADRERNAAELQAMREKNAAEIEAILVKANISAEIKQQTAVQDAQQKAVEGAQSLSFQQAAHQQTMVQNAEAESAAEEKSEGAEE